MDELQRCILVTTFQLVRTMELSVDQQTQEFFGIARKSLIEMGFSEKEFERMLTLWAETGTVAMLAKLREEEAEYPAP